MRMRFSAHTAWRKRQQGLNRGWEARRPGYPRQKSGQGRQDGDQGHQDRRDHQRRRDDLQRQLTYTDRGQVTLPLVEADRLRIRRSATFNGRSWPFAAPPRGPLLCLCWGISGLRSRLVQAFDLMSTHPSFRHTQGDPAGRQPYGNPNSGQTASLILADVIFGNYRNKSDS